jgi:hypothetical protein
MCANTGCTESRYDKPCRKHASELRLFCERVCKDAVCTATGLRAKDLRWAHVHDHHHSLEVEGGKDPRIEHGGGGESPNN